MKKVVTSILDTLKVFFLFVFCTILFYFGLEWLDHNYESFHKYDVPNDGAVKVFNSTQQNDLIKGKGSERFFQFLRDGE